MDNSDKVLVIVNLAICLFGGFVCVCRMGLMRGPLTKPEVRAQYILWFVMFVVSGLSWTFDQAASIAQILMSGLVLVSILTKWKEWRYGAPPHTQRWFV
jgi:hypothetical protein